MDQSLLKSSDALILTGITEAPTANPDAMLGEFCTHLGKNKNDAKNLLLQPVMVRGHALHQCNPEFVSWN